MAGADAIAAATIPAARVSIPLVLIGIFEATRHQDIVSALSKIKSARLSNSQTLPPESAVNCAGIILAQNYFI